MKILTRYLLRSLLFPLFYCLLAFVLIYIIAELFDNFGDLLESGISAADMARYYSLVLPPVIVQTLPVCLLLATLYSLSILTRHSEITAMRAGGVSIYRVVIPFIAVGAVAAIATAFLNEKVTPDAAYRASKFMEYHRAGGDASIYFIRNLALKNNQHVWMIQRLDTRDYSMHNVELIRQRADGSDEVKYQAGRAMWVDGRWWFTDVTIQRYRPNGDLDGPPSMLLQREMRELSETPQTFLSEIKEPHYMSSSEMRRYLRSRQDVSSRTRALLRTDLHARLAAPFICLIVTIIGVPVGAHTGRKGAFAGIMTAVSLFFAFYLLQLVSQALGKQEMIPAWLGGWLPVLVFGAASPLMIYRMR